jgi:hypothetical protein
MVTGAKRKNTLFDGISFCETVVESNGSDSITTEISDHPFPCDVLIAKMFTRDAGDKGSILGLSFQYQPMEGIDGKVLDSFKNTFEKMGEKIIENVKDIFKKRSPLRFDLECIEASGESKLCSSDVIIL